MTRQERKFLQEESAQFAVRKYMPYGLFLNKANGKVLLFNREYEVMEYAGQREFHIDPIELGINYTFIRENGFLMTEDGLSYVGCFYFLYSDDQPYYFGKASMISYYQRLDKLMGYIVNCVGNSYNEGTSTKKQTNEVKRLRKKYYPKNQ